jgi:O-antigen biosynthesis protein
MYEVSGAGHDASASSANAAPITVSVVIPCFNAAPYLAQTIGSVLEQTVVAHEILVVDDGSTDGSRAIAERFAAAAPDRVRVVSERSGQAARTRNLGALDATGTALFFLDADDVLAPDTLEALTAGLARQPDAIAICPWYRLERVDGCWVRRPPSCRPRRPGEDALSAWLTGWYHPPCSVLWSRAAFERAGRWDERANPNDDGDLMMRALAAGVALVETSSGAGYYRRLPAGHTSLSGTRFSDAGLSARLWTIEKIAAWLEERGCLGAYRKPLQQAALLVAGDAGDPQHDLRARAEALAASFPRAFWPVRHQPAGGAATATRGAAASPAPVAMGVPVTHGLAVSAAVLGTPAAATASGGAPAPVPSRRHRPTVTVIIPTYNRADLLPRALGSVLAQTFTDFEVLVVDDGSIDGTDALMTAYTDSRVRYLRQPVNAGVSAARNRGLRESRGEFIAFLDSDDEWYPEKLTIQVERMRTLPDTVGLLHCGVENHGPDGTVEVFTPSHHGDIHHTLLRVNVLHGAPSGALLRRSVVATAGFFDEGIPAIEDYDYWLRITRFFEVAFLETPLVRYFDPPEGQRKSLHQAHNLRARVWLFRKHARAMRRAGVAHLFLLETAHRALRPPASDAALAAGLAARAVTEKPTALLAHGRCLRAILHQVMSAPSRPLGGSSSVR